MNSNSITRIKYLFLQDLSMNRKRYTGLVVGLFLGIFALMCLVHPHFKISAERYQYYAQSFYRDINESISIYIVCATLVFIAELFANFATKQKRVHQLMLPATKGEKFAARFLLCCVVLPLVFVVCIGLADVLRWILSPIFFEATLPLTCHKLIPEMLLKTTFYWEGETSDHVLFCSFMVWIATYYALGSAVFRRRAAIKSTLLMLGGFILMVTFLENFDVPGEHTVYGDFDVMRIIVSIILLVLSVVQLFLTRRQYNRIQVIAKKKWYDRF